MQIPLRSAWPVSDNKTPKAGRPKGRKTDFNLHAYVGADPVNFTDPLGLAQQDIVITGRTTHPQNPIFVVGARELMRDFSRITEPQRGTRETPQTRPLCDEAGADPYNCDPVVNGPADEVDDGANLWFASQRGNNNQRSNEFRHLSDNELAEQYKKAKEQQRMKLQREMKARSLKNLNKIRKGGMIRGPIFILPDWLDHFIRCYPGNRDPACLEA